MTKIKSDMEKEDKKIKIDKYEENIAYYSSIAFIVVIFIFGVPIWWKTTEIYRENIPNTAIMELNNEDIKISTNIFIYTTSIVRTKQLSMELIELFDDHLLLKVNIIPIDLRNTETSNIHTPTKLENLIQNVYELKTGDFLFIEWQTLEEHILLTTDRTAYITNQTSAIEMYTLLEHGPFKTFPLTNQSTTALNHGKIEKSFELKTHPLEHEHDILISILNPKPEKMHAKWNVRKTAQLYLEPFLQHINQLSNFSVKTQWKFHVPFEFPLKQINDVNGRHYKLTEDELPHLITSIEKYLGFESSEKIQTHIVIYILPCDISPIHIYNKNNLIINQNNLNSFLSLKWGGFILYNPPSDLCSNIKNDEKLEFNINSNEIVKTVLYHLEKIFEIHTDIKLDNVKLIEKMSLEPRKWEIDGTIRRNIIRYIYTATKTLQSLVQLLENISYIVINQNVANSINKSYNNIELAKKSLLNGNLNEALLYSKEAFKQSEEVFFEASLLAQLYFPDEQKYAIYIPLFLPITVPVLTSLPFIEKLTNKN